jgi:PAS domain S-box-containing protein
MTSRDQLSKTMRIEIDANPREDWHPKAYSAAPPQTSRKKIIVRAVRPRNTPRQTQSNELQELFQNTYDAAFITDFSGVISSANVRASEFFSFTREEMTGANISELIVGFGEKILETIAENLNEGRFTLLEAQCIRADNSRFLSEISTSLLQLASGDCLCFFLRDITERREAEVSLQAANESLRIEIAERQRVEAKLNEAIAKLQEHDKAQTQFVSNVSHELKTPLASIHYMTGNMLKGVLGPVPETMIPYMNMIREDCTRLRRTVEDILDMSRSEAGLLVLRRVSVAFSRFIRQSTSPLGIQAEAANLQLRLTLDDHLGFVQCDPRKLERVVTNIVKNAIKFNREGGSIHVQAWRETHADGQWVCLCVDDTGIGIAPEHLPHITERFYRVGEFVSGSGLGLCISKELILRHGGQLKIESPPPGANKGTRVLVRLPSIETPSILLIHSGGDILDVVTRTMTDVGYSLQSVPLAEATAQRLESSRPDYMIIDWSTPDMSGAAIISAISAIPHLATVPLLVITGPDANPAQREILRGFNIPAVQSPLTEQRLLRSFDNILADHAS